MLKTEKIDLHIHTTYSDGNCSLEEALRIAGQRGLMVVAITDHYSEFQRASKRMGSGQLHGYLDALESTGLIKGVEVEIIEDGTVSISPRNADLFDLVIGGVHNLHNRVFWKDPRPIWNPKAFVEDLRLVIIKAIETDLLDVLAHPTWLPWAIRHMTDRFISKDWMESVINAAQDHGVAMEINGAWRVPDEQFVRECLHQGVKLSIGSDAHNCNMIGKVSYPVEVLRTVEAKTRSIFIPGNRK